MSVSHDSAPAGRRVVAEIDPAYLWGRPVDPSTRTGICVSDAKGKAFFCTPDAAPAALQLFASQMREGVAGRDSFDQGGIAYIASHHPLVLEPEIAGRGWSIIATRPMPDVLAPIAELESMLLAMVGVAALIVAVLGVTQIRRALRSVDGLREGVRRVGEKDFSVRVDVDGNDEFGDARRVVQYDGGTARRRVHRDAHARPTSTRPSCPGSISTA